MVILAYPTQSQNAHAFSAVFFYNVLVRLSMCILKTMAITIIPMFILSAITVGNKNHILAPNGNDFIAKILAMKYVSRTIDLKTKFNCKYY